MIPPKPKYYPLKPKTIEGFKKAVAWFGGRELLASLKGVLLYAIYGENMDSRSWMKPNIYPNVEDKVKNKAAEKYEKVVAAEFKKNANEQLNLNSVLDNQVAQKINTSDEVKEDIIEQVNQEWAKKVFDYWEWKRTNFKFWEDYLKDQTFWQKLQPEKKELEEFWFDFIADSGDGQLGVFAVGCLAYSDLWLEKDEIGSVVKFSPPEKPGEQKFSLLPRGYFLFVGGDTAYHSANYETLYDRFQTPFRWAFANVRRYLIEKYDFQSSQSNPKFFKKGELSEVFIVGKIDEEWDGTFCAEINEKTYWDTEPPRPIFGIPGNHDYYDNVAGFNKQFRCSPFDETKENMVYEDGKGSFVLQIPTFSREQEASYIAIHLPFDWWMFGIDSENEKLDFRQEIFFKQIMKEKSPSKLILATPEPTTVFGKKSKEKDKTATYLKSLTESLGLEQPFLNEGKFKKIVDPNSKITPPEQICRLDISGDVHHYARYWGENSRDLESKDFSADNYASLVAGGGGAFFDSTSTLVSETIINNQKVPGEIPPQRVYPSDVESIEETADKIFDLRNIRKGGYIQSAGAISAVIIFYFLTQFSNVSKITTEELKNFLGLKDILQYLLPISLLLVIGCLAFCANAVNKLIKKIKELSFDNDPQQFIFARITKLLITASPLFIGILIYIGYLSCWFSFQINSDWKFLSGEPVSQLGFVALSNYLHNLYLLFHIIIAILLIWLSCEYTNWLAVRFKITRKLNDKTYTQDWENPDEETATWYQKIIASILRAFSYKYFAANALIVLAVLALIFGAGMFGRTDFLLFISDLIITLIIIGGIYLYVGVLAYSVGASYQNRQGKINFFLIGIWHAVLQLATPIILFFYANWAWFAIIFVLTLGFNGFSKATYRVKKLFHDPQENNLKRKIIDLLEFSLGSEILKQNNKFLLTFVWFLFGLLVLLTPIIAPYFSTSFISINHAINNFSQYLAQILAQQFITDYTKLIYTIISFLFIGFVGHRMSRVWFSWYLAVSLLFNGHNNEVGGMARIEDFKHLVRVKVGEKKLTVYVIGLDYVKPELSELEAQKSDEKPNLKLVDKFELDYLPVP